MPSKIQLTKLIKITVTWRSVGSCRPLFSHEDGAILYSGRFEWMHPEYRQTSRDYSGQLRKNVVDC